MTLSAQTAFFLWVGNPLPDMARISVLSAAEAGFDTVLFTDRSQDVSHPKLRQADWREIELPWGPESVRLKGEGRPCYAAFSDLFRYAVLAQQDGWWFDCDTLLLRPVADFAALLSPGHITVGREDASTINGAVIGSRSRSAMQMLYDSASLEFPVLGRWGIVGPALISRLISEGRIKATVVDQPYFYPVHHNDIAQIYLPDCREALEARLPDWFCLSLWGEVLSRSGLRYLAPPSDSLLGRLLAERPELGGIAGDAAGMAGYLADNLRRLESLDSGSVAMRTLLRKAGQRAKRIGAFDR